MEHPVPRSMYMDWKGEEEMGTNLFCHYFTTRKKNPLFLIEHGKPCYKSVVEEYLPLMFNACKLMCKSQLCKLWSCTTLEFCGGLFFLGSWVIPNKIVKR